MSLIFVRTNQPTDPLKVLSLGIGVWHGLPVVGVATEGLGELGV